jgi:hypothetical protein
MKNLAVRNWLRRARLVNVEESDPIDVTDIMVTVDDEETAVSNVEASELSRAKVSGTPVSFVLIDD